MTYAIIGSGAIGSALASQFARNRIDVLLTNSRGPDSLGDLVRKLGKNVTPVSMREASAAEIVILAVPFKAVPSAVRDYPGWNGRIVVDATNAVSLPAFTPMNLGPRASSEIVTEAVPGARVVKAFNTLPAALSAADPAQDGGRRVLFLSGDHADANGVIAGLIERFGFAPVDLGKLSEGGRLQQFGGALAGLNLIKL